MAEFVKKTSRDILNSILRWSCSSWRKIVPRVKVEVVYAACAN